MSSTAAETDEPSFVLPDAEELRCRQYGWWKCVLMLAELLVLVTFLAGLTLTGAAAAVVAFTHSPGTPRWLGDLLFLVTVGFLLRTLLLPIQVLNEYYVEERFGLNCQSFWCWLWEWTCRSVVFSVATVVLLLPVVETLRWWPLLVLPWCAAFLLLRKLFVSHVYYPLLACFYPVRFLRYETFNLPGIDRVTLPVYEVQVSHKTRRVNAGIRVCGKQTAIYVTDTLIDAFTDGEERVVMAHEFGHLYDQLHLEERTRAGVAQAHRKLALGSAQLLAGLVSLCLLHWGGPLLGLGGVHELATFPLLVATTLVIAQALSPWLCAEARKDERDADEYALAATRDVDSYVSVMCKLRRLNLEESCPTPLSRFLFGTHPTYDERVHLAQHYRRRYHGRRKARHWRGWRGIQNHGRR